MILLVSSAIALLACALSMAIMLRWSSDWLVAQQLIDDRLVRVGSAWLAATITYVVHIANMVVFTAEWAGWNVWTGQALSTKASEFVMLRTSEFIMAMCCAVVLAIGASLWPDVRAQLRNLRQPHVPAAVI